MLLDFTQVDQGQDSDEPTIEQPGAVIKGSKVKGIDIKPLIKACESGAAADLERFPDEYDKGDPHEGTFPKMVSAKGSIIFGLAGRDPDRCGPIFTSQEYVLDPKNGTWKRATRIYCINQLTGSIQDLSYAAAGSTRAITNSHINLVLRAVLQSNVVRYDEVKRLINIGDRVFNMDDAKLLHLQLSEQYQVNFTDVKGSIFSMARENTYNSFREELDRIEKEVKPYPIEKFCREVLKLEDETYIAMVTLQLIATIIRSGGYKSSKWGLLYWRQLLVLIAAQGTGKDNLILFLFCGEATTAPPIPQLDTREKQKSMNKSMVLRFGEMNKFVRNSVDLEKLKDWLAELTFTWVDKWMIEDTTETRRSVCWGSSNDHRWMSDPTGNTRFWNVPLPFEKGEVMDLDKVKEIREGLWASAIEYARRYEAGEWCPYLCDEFNEIQKVLLERESSHTLDSPYLNSFIELVDDEVKVLTYEHLSQITGIDVARLSRKGPDRTMVQMVLKELGFGVETERVSFKGGLKKDNRRNCFVRMGADLSEIHVQKDLKRVFRKSSGLEMRLV